MAAVAVGVMTLAALGLSVGESRGDASWLDADDTASDVWIPPVIGPDDTGGIEPDAVAVDALLAPTMAAASSGGSTFPHPLATQDAQDAIAWAMANLGASTVREALYHVEYFTETHSVGAVGSYSRMSARIAQRSGPMPSGVVAPSYHEVAFGLAGEWLSGAVTPPAVVDVWISTQFPSVNPVPNVTHELMVQIADGSITTMAELKAARDAWIETRTAAGTAWLTPLLSWVQAQGGVVMEAVPLAGVARIQLPFAGLDDLLARAEVTAVSAHDVGTDDVSACDPAPGGTMLNGRELRDVIQAGQFYDDLKHGEGVVYGVSESSAQRVFRAHPGFEDDLGVQRYRNCLHSLCQNANPTQSTDPGNHATASASVLLGDITLGQDANFAAGSAEAEKRSGVARAATAVGVTSDRLAWSVNQFSSAVHGVELVSRSSSVDGDDRACTGATPLAQAWESMYESGVGLFNSTGNNTYAIPTDCRVAAPATAVGVFAVSQGAVIPDGRVIVTSTASRGGTSVEGRGRSIVSMLGPQPIRNPFSHYVAPVMPTSPFFTIYRADYGDIGLVGFDENNDGSVDNSEFGAHGESSAATPVVAGVAGLFHQWHLAEKGAQVVDPGYLYANMLLMGDRTDQNGLPLLEGYDSLSGAGAVRARKWDDEGVDDPGHWVSGSVCISRGQTIDVPLNPEPGAPAGVNALNKRVPAEVDYAKAVLWYDDPGFTQDVANILDSVALDLILIGVETTLIPLNAVPVRTDDSTDHKKRVYAGDVGGTVPWIRLRADGFVSRPPSAQCGFRPNTMVVHYAAVWEDDARDNAGLTCVREEP